LLDIIVVVVIVLGLQQMTKKAFQFYFQIRKIETIKNIYNELFYLI